MTGGKRAHGTSRFIRHLRMKRALRIQSSGSLWPTRQMRGKDRRRGTWWDQKLNCIAIEGQDFAQDTQEGGADEFVLIPDSDEERGAKASSLLADDDEYVPETEPQDVVTVSRIIGTCGNQGRQRLGTMLHEWRRLISDVENESGKMGMESSKVQLDSVKLEKESAKVEMESGKLEMCAKVQMGGVKLEIESNKLDNVKLEKELDHMASFSDIETDDDSCLIQDGVDLRGYSQVEDDDFNEQVDHLNQMDGLCYHLVQKQADDFEKSLSPIHIRVETKVISSPSFSFGHCILQGIMCNRTLVEIRHLIPFLIWYRV